MTLLNDREAEMALGSTLTATTASNHNDSLLSLLDQNNINGTASTGSADSPSSAQPVDALNDILHDALGLNSLHGGGSSSVADPIRSLVENHAASSALPVLHDAASPLVLAGDGSPLQPVLNATNTAILDVHAVLEAVGHEVGLPQAVHGVTDLGETAGLGNIGTVESSDGHTNLVTDTLNAPGEILSGDLDGVISHLGGDLTDTVNAATNLVNSVIMGGDPTNPVGDVITNLGQDLQHLPLLNINGGNNANDGGLIGGIAGNLSSSSGGHLIDLDVGPQSSGGQAIDLLSQSEAGPHHMLEVNAVDIGSGGPQLLDLGLLTGSNGLNVASLVPSLGGTGTDGLTGGLTNGLLGGTIASGNTTTVPVATPVNAPINIDAVHDLLNAPLATDHGILDTHGSHIL